MFRPTAVWIVAMPDGMSAIRSDATRTFWSFLISRQLSIWSSRRKPSRQPCRLNSSSQPSVLLLAVVDALPSASTLSLVSSGMASYGRIGMP